MALGNLNDEELHKLFDLPDTIGVIHRGRVRWAGNVARKEEKRMRTVLVA